MTKKQSNAIAWVNYHPRQLTVTRKKSKPPIEEFERLVLGMDVELESSGFWRADAMIWGVVWYGESKAIGVLDPVRSSVKTWQNNLSVGLRLPPDEIRVVDGKPEYDPDSLSRRREELSYSHHAEVAYVEPDQFPKDSDFHESTAEDIQDYYLRMAIENHLSGIKLRALIKFDKGESELDPLDVNFQTGTLLERMAKTRDRISKHIEDVPPEWDPERELLEGAFKSIQSAIESGRNRRIGESNVQVSESPETHDRQIPVPDTVGALAE